jgi:hypothetical protein
MENLFFYRLQYAVFSVLYMKKEISEKEFREMTAFLHKKLRGDDEDGR